MDRKSKFYAGNAVVGYLFNYITIPRAGIDGGGVFKEFFTSLCHEVFDTDRGLWLANKENELYPNPHTYATEGPFSFFSLFTVMDLLPNMQF